MLVQGATPKLGAANSEGAQPVSPRENARLRGDLLTFARRISHDMRTPLGGIITAGETLREILSENESSVAVADSLLRAAEDLATLVKRTSFLARATAAPLPKRPVAMQEVVSRVLQQLESRILRRHAAITGPPAWPEIDGVAAWLEIIWWNLLANALQHAGDAPQIAFGWRGEGQAFKFWLSDNGGGVPEKLRPRLFQTFDSLHEDNCAAGLGLPIVQRLVELQGGRCGYEPSPTGGACFFFVC